MSWDTLQPLLFSVDSERAHHAAVRTAAASVGVLRATPGAWATRSERLHTSLAGLHLANPFGLAAGFDKDGRFASVAPALGFGFHCLGTVTPRPQGGNPKPRMWRISADRALVNRMGFPNPGAAAVVPYLQAARARAELAEYPYGFSIGKNKDTPNESAVDDYVAAYREVRRVARFVEVNVSSPNTAGLRDLQTGDFLGSVLDALRAVDDEVDDGRRPPYFLKVAPDLDDAQIEAVAGLAQSGRAQGICATNTLPYSGPVDSQPDAGGGLSGAPLTERSFEVLQALRQAAGPEVPLVSIGGIASGAEALRRLQAGASAIQVYSAFVYRGPRLAKLLCDELLAAMDAQGIESIAALR
jgi:dihydroorotate dehydrogenase